MLFKLKKEVKKTPEILCRENIKTHCKPKEKKEVIRMMGQMLVDGGYVKEDYISAMQERELVFSTNMGNGLALPHGIDKSKGEILQSGIAVMVFTNGVQWDDSEVFVVIGIAGKGEEHLDILSNIAEKFIEEDAVDVFMNLDEDGIYQALTK